MSLRYQNPIIHADYADPDVIRTGDDFWLVSSSFNQLPGIPILHSRDLVHWQIVNHVIPRLPAGEYDTVQPGKGVWAPSIRYHAGRFWVFFSIPDDGIFLCHTDDPRGQWSTPVCLKRVPGWIDPCPFWDDDGRAWLVHGFAYSRSGIKNKLQLIEMAPDGSHLLDDGRIIVDGTLSHPTLEGPKLYKYNGLYWIFCPAGGVKRGWQTVMRATSLTGPWEIRDVLHQGDTPINGPHQGGWIALDNGEHWFIHFQDKGVYGRIIHLQPMRWQEDGWPLIGTPIGEGKGQPVMSHSLPTLPLSPCSLQTSDDFSHGQPGLQWQWQANPRKEWLLPGQSGLTLRCAPLAKWQGACALYATPQLLLQKWPAARFTLTVSLQPTRLLVGDEGGLVFYGERYAALCVVQTKQGQRLQLRHGWMSDKGVLEETCYKIADLSQGEGIELVCDVSYDGICRFFYRPQKGEFHPVSQTFSAGAGKWIGARMGIYAGSSQENSEGHIRFEAFKVTLTD